MKVTAVILPSVQEQREAGEEVIDPEKIDLTEWQDGRHPGPAPIFRDGIYRVPDGVVGNWSNPRVEDGRLVVDAEIDGLTARHGQVGLSFAGIHGGGQARLIAVHAVLDPPTEEG